MQQPGRTSLAREADRIQQATAADARRRALAAGIATAALLSATLDPSALRAWGWRLAFLLALPLGLVGLHIRLRIEETPGFRAVQRLDAAARTPLADTLRTTRRAVVLGFGLVAAVTATFNTVFVFLPSHLATTGAPRWPGRWPRRWPGCWWPPVPRRWRGGSPTGWVAGRCCSPASSPSWCS
jgi:MFS family permease